MRSKQSSRSRLVRTVVALALAAAPALAVSAQADAATTYDVGSYEQAYGPGGTQKVTVYRPDAPGARPVAYFIHGGGWVGGDRDDWAAYAYAWARQGWVTINIDYTRGDVAGDGAKMLADVTKVVDKYEAAAWTNEGRQVLVGDSAGGHLATTVGAKLRGHFAGVVAWSPVVSPQNAAADGARAGASSAQQLLGTRAQRFWAYSYGTTNPVPYVRAYGGPPMWIAASRDEFVVWDHQGGVLCTALRTFGQARCEPHVVAGTRHGTDLRDVHADLQESAYDFAMRMIGARG